MISKDLDLFSQINNAVLDLQASQQQTFQRPLKALARLLQHADLAEANSELTSGVDLGAFLAASEKTGGSMAGTQRLEWPDDRSEQLGLILLLIEKLAADINFVENFCLDYFYVGDSYISAIHALVSQVFIPFARDYRAYVLSSGDTQHQIIRLGSNKVFIVHGHDEAALQGLARFIEKLGLEAIILREQPNQGRTIIEKYEASANEVGFAVVLLTPDDLGAAVSAQEQSSRARQNVIFELGYFSGKLGRGRVCLLRKGDVEMPSDLFGIVYTDMDAADGWKHRLVVELKAAKLEFDANKLWA